MTAFRRLLELERAEGAPRGVVRGVLATDGEASDGHILSIEGGEATPGIPLLFGHDDFSGDRHLGAWTTFRRVLREAPKKIVGEAEIELEGAGKNRDFREDVATMVEKKRIRGFSIRWEPTAPPIARVNLASDHPAFVDAEADRGSRRRWGLYFPKWRALEGSIVSIGSDRLALIERSQGDSPCAALYRSAVASHDANEGAFERELAERISALELYLPAGAVPDAAEASTARVTRPREATDRLLERIWREEAERQLGGAFLEEIEKQAKVLLSKATGRTR